MTQAVLRNVDRGDSITSTVVFTNTAGVPTAPSTVTFYVISPVGPSSQTAYVSGTATEVTNPTTGTYVLTLPMTMSGVWEIRAVGTGAVAEAVRGVIKVDSDPFS